MTQRRVSVMFLQTEPLSHSGAAPQYGSNKKKGRKEDKEEVSMAY
jgi:hypothetical protein